MATEHTNDSKPDDPKRLRLIIDLEPDDVWIHDALDYRKLRLKLQHHRTVTKSEAAVDALREALAADRHEMNAIGGKKRKKE